MGIIGFSEAWVETILHSPWTARWTAEAAEGPFVLCLAAEATPLIGDQKRNDEEKAIYGLHYNNECMYDLKKRQTSIGFKVNLFSFDMFSGGHIYKAHRGSLYTTLCIYMLQVWVASVISLLKTEMKTKKRNVETLRPSFYRSNINYNCNLLFFDKRRVDSSLLLSFCIFVLKSFFSVLTISSECV